MITMAKGNKGDGVFVTAELEVGSVHVGQGKDELAALRDLLSRYTEDTSTVLDEIDLELNKWKPGEDIEQWIFSRRGGKVERNCVTVDNVQNTMYAETPEVAISLIRAYARVRFSGTEEQADRIIKEAQESLHGR